LLIIDPLEANPTSYVASIQTEYPPLFPQALQEARQFSAEGTSMSIDGPSHAVTILYFQGLANRCDKLANQGRFG